MRWSDERYVKVYTRDSGEWALVSWQAKGLFYELMRKCDGAGLIFLGRHGIRGLASLLRAPESEIKPFVEELLADGCVEIQGAYLVIRNFVAAQEATASEKLRKQHQREMDKAKAVLGARANAEAPEIAQGECHADPGARTACHNQPSPAQPSPAQREKPCAEPEDAPARARPVPRDDSPVVALLPVVGKGPKEYPVTEAKVREWAEAYPGVDVLREVRALVQWSRDNPTKRKTYRGAPAFFSRNLARKQDKNPNRTVTHHEQPTPLATALAESEQYLRGGADLPLLDLAGDGDGEGESPPLREAQDGMAEDGASLPAAIGASLVRRRATG